MSRSEIDETLSVYIEPKKLFRFFSEHTVFEGTMNSDGFKVMRIINYRNSFLPVIVGRFIPGQSGITVAIHMRLQAFTFVFMCVWLGFAGTGIFSYLWRLLAGQNKNNTELLATCGMFLFGYALTVIFFWIEARKAKRQLNEMFR